MSGCVASSLAYVSFSLDILGIRLHLDTDAIIAQEYATTLIAGRQSGILCAEEDARSRIAKDERLIVRVQAIVSTVKIAMSTSSCNGLANRI